MSADPLSVVLACLGVADSTASRYQWYLIRLSAFLEAQGKRLEDVDPTSFMAWLDGYPQWSPNSRRFAVAALRSYVRQVHGDSHPCLKIRMRRVDPGPQRTIMPDEARKLIGWLEGRDMLDITDPKKARDLAMVSLMLDTGIRSAEVARLRVENVDLAHQQLQVLVKGGRWRTAIFSRETRVRLRYWLGLRDRIALPIVPEVFVGVGGKTRGRRMVPDGLRATFRRMASQAGLKHFSPHSLRRGMCVGLLLNGASSRIVQMQGGWSNVNLVETYSRQLPSLAAEPYLATRQLANADVEA